MAEYEYLVAKWLSVQLVYQLGPLSIAIKQDATSKTNESSIGPKFPVVTREELIPWCNMYVITAGFLILYLLRNRNALDKGKGI